MTFLGRRRQGRHRISIASPEARRLLRRRNRALLLSRYRMIGTKLGRQFVKLRETLPVVRVTAIGYPLLSDRLDTTSVLEPSQIAVFSRRAHAKTREAEGVRK